MGQHPTKAADNAYCKARLEAAKCNERLYSREGAAELLGLSLSTLSGYELETQKPVPETVLLMSDLYNAPELKSRYCYYDCAIGRQNVCPVQIAQLEQITLKLLAAFQQEQGIATDLITIASDGVIDASERPVLEGIIGKLGEIELAAAQLKLWAEKNLR